MPDQVISATIVKRAVSPAVLMRSALFLLPLVLQGCSTTGPARAAPGAGDVTIDDSRVFPESITSSRDGTLFAGSIKGIIYRAPARDR